jgi:hypothetical protein
MKYWCHLPGGPRVQVTLANCAQCDKEAGLAEGSWHYCTSRNPYRMQIQEFCDDLIWWAELLWRDPRAFPYYAASELFHRLGQRWGTCTEVHEGRRTMTLMIGLKGPRP